MVLRQSMSSDCIQRVGEERVQRRNAGCCCSKTPRACLLSQTRPAVLGVKNSDNDEQQQQQHWMLCCTTVVLLYYTISSLGPSRMQLFGWRSQHRSQLPFPGINMGMGQPSPALMVHGSWLLRHCIALIINSSALYSSSPDLGPYMAKKL